MPFNPAEVRRCLETMLAEVRGCRCQACTLLRRILDQPGGVEALCELYQPIENPDHE